MENGGNYDLDCAIIDHRYKHLKIQAARSQYTRNLKISTDCKPKLLYSMSRCYREKSRLSALWLLGKLPAKPAKCGVCGAVRVKQTHIAASMSWVDAGI